MNILLFGLVFGLLLAMVLLFARIVSGPTIYDRALAASTLSTLTVLLIAMLSFVLDQPGWLDIALVGALLGFVAIIAVVKSLSLRAGAASAIPSEAASPNAPPKTLSALGESQ